MVKKSAAATTNVTTGTIIARLDMLPLTPGNQVVTGAGKAQAGSMDAQNTAGGILRQLIDSAPQARDVEITLVQPYHQEIRFLLA